jgi:septal ring factor EnvC (AmiA/AmiB activator)
MAYGVINIKYGGAESTKFVERNEFYAPQSVPSGAQVDHYINLEYYSNLEEDLEEVTCNLRSAKDSYSGASRRLQNTQVENDKLREQIRELQEQLERANRVIDYMLERSE